MNILICDDMKNEADKLVRLLDSSGFDIKRTVFHSGTSALAFYRKNKAVDVCFLDIVMPEMSGVELAAALREDGFKGEIVFLSTSKEYGPDTYRVKAFDYLLKPTTPEAVRNVLLRIEDARKNSDTDGIMVSTKGHAAFVLLRDIEYAEVILHTVYFKLTDNGSVEMSTAFAEISPQLLRDKRFAQCHRSYIVNLNAVSAITGFEITMRSGTKIPISRSYADVKKKYLDWGLEKNKQ